MRQLFRKRFFAAAVIFFAWLPFTGHAEETQGEEVSVTVAGKTVQGLMVLPATEKGFALKNQDAFLYFRWEQLEPQEKQRVQKLCGLKPADQAKKAFGKEINALRLTLKNGRAMEGLPLPGRDRPGEKAFKTTALAVLYVPERDIEKSETFTARESDFFTPLEFYERALLEKPPGKDDAAAQLEFARLAADLELFDQALKQLDCAELIDARTAERNKPFRQELAGKQAGRRALELYNQVLRDQAAGDFFAALDKLDLLDRNFPNSELRTRWQPLRPILEAGAKSSLAKQAVQMSYNLADEILKHYAASKARVDEKGNLVAALPGKQVTTRLGRVFLGVLKSQDPDGDTVIVSGDTLLTIKTEDIAMLQDVDLSVAAKEVERSWEEMKNFVSDAQGPGGLKAQMIARIAKVVKTPEAKVREIFDGRLQKAASYENGRVIQAPVYASVHSASYGVGTWLREGSKIMPSQAAPAPVRVGLNGQPIAQPAAESENPDTTDDPEVWWKHQHAETKLAILRALCGEKVFQAKAVEKIPCKDCAGAGGFNGTDQNGAPIFKRCPACRGMGIMIKVSYE